jgi:hypothetical protein
MMTSRVELAPQRLANLDQKTSFQCIELFSGAIAGQKHQSLECLASRARGGVIENNAGIPPQYGRVNHE